MRKIISTSEVRLREALEKADLTQVELGKITGLEQSVISRITTGRFRASVEEKIQIAAALGKPVNEVFPG